MTARFASLLIVSLCVCAAAAQQFTQGVRNCRRNNLDRFNQCLMNEIKKIQPLLGDGFPELNFPPMEPLLLGNFDLRQSVPPVAINANFHNVLVYGFTKFDLKYLHFDFSTARKQSMGLTIPSLLVKGQYKIGGNVFVLPIEGEGNMVMDVDGVIAEGNGDIVREAGKVFLRNVNIGFKIRTLKIRLDNLFQGNQILSDTVHHFINENSDLVIDELRPTISKLLNDFFEEVFNTVFAALPADAIDEIRANGTSTA